MITSVLNDLKAVDQGALVRDAANLIVDELFTNAIFNAPLDRDGFPLNAHHLLRVRDPTRRACC